MPNKYPLNYDVHTQLCFTYSMPARLYPVILLFIDCFGISLILRHILYHLIQSSFPHSMDQEGTYLLIN